MAVDRTTLRRAVGDKIGDLLVLSATENAASTSTFSDVVHLGDRGDRSPSIVNRIGYFSGGTADNLGHECRVTDFVAATRTLTLAPQAPVEPQTGDLLELWSVAERIGSIGAIHRLLNDGIRAVDRWAELETWDSEQTFDARAPYLTIPVTWIEIGGADWTDRRGFLHAVPQSRLQVRPGLMTVEITGNTACRAHRRPVRLWGYARSLPLAADVDSTVVDPEWLVESVVGVITLAGSWRGTDSGAAERKANYWSTQALAYRRNIAAPRRGLGVMLA